MSILNFPLSASRKLLTSIPAPSPREDGYTGWSSPYLNVGTLNSDLVVILAAMVCALICAFGLSPLFRYARCWSRRRGSNSSDGVVNLLANTGLRKAAKKALPIVVYASPTKLPPGLATDCPICLAEFGEGEKVRVLPNCNHAFHMECIDKWFTTRSSCPMCRHCMNVFCRNRKPGGAAIAQATDSNNAIDVVIESTDSAQAIPPRAETLERTPQEATEVTVSSPLPLSSVSENQS